MEKPVEKLKQQDVVMISRVNFNYGVIALSFLILGMVMGAIGYERLVQSRAQDTAALVEQSVIRALAASDSSVQGLIDRSVAAAISSAGGQQQARLNPDERYDIVTAENPETGPADAPVTIVEFSDFRCGYCGKFARETLQPLLASYEGDVRIVYRDYIIFGQPSYEAALAAECADDQGQFWEFHNAMFANQETLGRDLFVATAETMNMDMDDFNACLDAETHRDEITADVAYGESLGITGTPTFFINGRPVSGAQPLETFQRIIDEEIAAAAQSAETAGT